MHRFSIVLMGLLIAGCVGHVATTEQSSNARVGVGAQSRSPLAGVWKVLELSSESSWRGWTVGTPPYLSVYIFTPKYYSYMFAPGAGPRRLFAGGPNQPSEAEKIAAYDSIVAGSGRGRAARRGAPLRRDRRRPGGARESRARGARAGAPIAVCVRSWPVWAWDLPLPHWAGRRLRRHQSLQHAKTEWGSD